MARLDRDPAADGPLIQGFTAAGGFKVDGTVHAAGLLLTPERAEGWDAPPLGALGEKDVAGILTPSPEFLLLGTGPVLARPPVAFTAALDARGIGIEAMDSRAAARLWGVLRAEGRWVAAALLPL